MPSLSEQFIVCRSHSRFGYPLYASNAPLHSTLWTAYQDRALPFRNRESAERVAAQYNAANPKAPKAFTLSVCLAEVA